MIRVTAEVVLTVLVVVAATFWVRGYWCGDFYDVSDGRGRSIGMRSQPGMLGGRGRGAGGGDSINRRPRLQHPMGRRDGDATSLGGTRHPTGPVRTVRSAWREVRLRRPAGQDLRDGVRSAVGGDGPPGPVVESDTSDGGPSATTAGARAVSPVRLRPPVRPSAGVPNAVLSKECGPPTPAGQSDRRNKRSRRPSRTARRCT